LLSNSRDSAVLIKYLGPPGQVTGPEDWRNWPRRCRIASACTRLHLPALCLHLPAARCLFLIAETVQVPGALTTHIAPYGLAGSCYLLALIESSNASRCNRQTGPDHRLAPGPVTRDAGIEKIREAAELAQPTGVTEGAPVLGLAGPPWGGAAAQVTSQVPSRTGRQVTALREPERRGQESRSHANPRAQLLKRHRRRLRCSPGKAPVSISISITSIFLPITARQLRQLVRSPSPLLITNSPLPPRSCGRTPGQLFLAPSTKHPQGTAAESGNSSNRPRPRRTSYRNGGIKHKLARSSGARLEAAPRHSALPKLSAPA
ncbi:hypothetical protein CCMA1212_001463, partial [Trichoderma ghanense]